MGELLTEIKRSQLLQQSKHADNYSTDWSKGKNRYERRLQSRMSSSVKTYNEIDMNKLFKDNILDVVVKVKGETDDYNVTMSFTGFLDEIQKQLKNDQQLDLRIIIRSLISAFNTGDVFIHCDCKDFQYRFNYWVTVNGFNSGQSENRPADITNPRDSKGAGCKHILLLLANNTWCIKVASVIYNYINYMEKHYIKLYADIIYPAIYGKKYEDPVQLDLDNTNDLDTSIDTIDTSNKWARTKNQFQKGNTQGIRFASNQPDKQISFDDLISDDQ